jgi:hypothetical protein
VCLVADKKYADAEALSLMERCCSIQESVLGDKDPSLADSYCFRGDIVRIADDWVQRLKFFQYTLDMCEFIFGDEFSVACARCDECCGITNE